MGEPDFSVGPSDVEYLKAPFLGFFLHQLLKCFEEVNTWMSLHF